MMGYVVNIEKASKENNNFRKVLYTAKNSQLVVMSLLPNEDIGEEVHNLDQFIRIEEGKGKAILDGMEHDIEAEWAVVIPAGTKHNIINTSPDSKMNCTPSILLQNTRTEWSGQQSRMPRTSPKNTTERRRNNPCLGKR